MMLSTNRITVCALSPIPPPKKKNTSISRFGGIKLNNIHTEKEKGYI